MSEFTSAVTVPKPSATACDPKRSRVARPGPVLQAGSSETKRLATAILEVLAGVRTPTDAAKTLGISLPRYYQLEQRALGGLLAACEPRSKGPRPSPLRQMAKLQRDLACCQRECARQQSLLRAAQRTVGLSPPQPPQPAEKNGAKKRRRRRPTARALRAARAIAVDSSGTNGENTVQPSPTGSAADGDGTALLPGVTPRPG